MIRELIRSKYLVLGATTTAFVMLAGFAFSFSVFIIESNDAVQLSITDNPNDEAYGSVKSKKHIKVVRKKLWYIAVRSNSSQTSVVKDGGILFLPQKISLKINKQHESQKIASIGNRCILYDNPSTKTNIFSSCNRESETITIVKDGYTVREISSTNPVIHSAPFEGGFMYITKADSTTNAQRVYSIGQYQAMNEKSTIKKTISSSARPILVSDHKTGNAVGVLIGNTYFNANNLSNNEPGVTLKAKDTAENQHQLVQQAGEILYRFLGDSPDILEGENDAHKQDAHKQTSQFVSAYSVRNGDLIWSKKLEKGFLYRELAISSNNEVILVGESFASNESKFCFVGAMDYSCVNPWEKNDLPKSIFYMNGGLNYIASGKLWMFDAISNSSYLLYSADDKRVESAQLINKTIHLSLLGRQATNASQFSNFLLSESPAKSDKRIESFLPTEMGNQSNLIVDIYRSTIMVYVLADNIKKPTIDDIKLLGLPIMPTHSIKYIFPTVHQPQPSIQLATNGTSQTTN